MQEQIILVIILTFILTTLFEAFIFLVQHNRYQQSFNREKNAFIVARKLDQLLLQTSDSSSTIQKIADFLPKELHFATGVVILYDKERKILRRVAASNTKEAFEAIKALKVPFSQIEIPIEDSRNLMSRAIKEKKEFTTNNVYDVFVPVFSPEDSKKIQTIMSTQSTIVYPIYVEDTPLGVFIASSKKTSGEITEYERDIINVFVNAAGIALQNAQLFNSLTQTTKNLTQANIQLKNLDNLKDEFISIASHDLRTPLTIIKNYLYISAKESGDKSSDLSKNITIAQTATESAITLVNDMLDVSRIEAGRIQIAPSVFGIDKLAKEIGDELQFVSSEKKIKIEVIDGHELNVMGDIDRTRQIISNLIGNAIKFTQENGKITVTLAKKDNEIEVSVSDTGIGIKKEDLPKLFTKFGRLDNSRVGVAVAPGTGLGLYITKKLVELQRGTIRVESEYQKGSKFIFTLPSA